MKEALIRRRSALSGNSAHGRKLSDYDLKEAYNTGLMSKIIRLKAGYALNDTLSFDSEEKQTFFEEHIASSVKQAAKFMLGFGRGVIVIFEVGDDLTKPLSPHEVPEKLELRVFSGDIAKGQEIDIDLFSKRYGKPRWYQINGHQVHHSRVIDFSYYKPVERDLPKYWYGGISETELIYDQLIADKIVQRASVTMLEKASTFVYKIEGYQEAIQNKQHQHMARYISESEDMRSIYGGLITDKEDDVQAISQSLTDLDKIDNVALRRLAMVTGLGMTVLIGEQASGLNSSGEQERQGFQDTVTNLQSDYLQEPLDEIARIFHLGKIRFKGNQGQSASKRMEYETKAIANAKILYEIGEDAEKYLEEKDVLKPNNWDEFWSENADDTETT